MNRDEEDCDLVNGGLPLLGSVIGGGGFGDTGMLYWRWVDFVLIFISVGLGDGEGKERWLDAVGDGYCWGVSSGGGGLNEYGC